MSNSQPGALRAGSTTWGADPEHGAGKATRCPSRQLPCGQFDNKRRRAGEAMVLPTYDAPGLPRQLDKTQSDKVREALLYCRCPA